MNQYQQIPEFSQETVRKSMRFGLIAALAFLLVAALRSMFFSVEPEGRAVIQRFGKVIDIKNPGLHFKLPLGIDRATFVPTERVLKEEFGFRTAQAGQRSQYEKTRAMTDESLMLTGDLNVIDVEWVVQFRVTDPVKYLFEVRNPRETIRDVSESVMRRIVGNRLGSDVLTVGRVEIAHETLADMQEILDTFNIGVRIERIELQDVTPPDKVKPAFNEVNEARQQRERLINEAEKQRNQIIPRARGEADEIVAEAEAYRAERTNLARGEAARFLSLLEAYREQPDITARRFYLEMVDEVLPNLRNIYILEEGMNAPSPYSTSAKPFGTVNAQEANKMTLSPKKSFAGGALLVVLALAGVVVMSSVYVIQEDEQAIVLQFGKLIGEPVTTPGVHFKVPFIQEVRRFDKKLIVWDGSPNQIPTLGREFISIDTTARWRIVDPLRFYNSVRDESGAQARLDDIIDSVVRDKISATELTEIVRSEDWSVTEEDLRQIDVVNPDSDELSLTGETKIGRKILTQSILDQAGKDMPALLGIELVDVRIKRLNYIPSVREQVFQRMISERQRIAAQFRSEGQGEASRINGDTARQLAVIRSEALRKAEMVRGEADAEATRTYNEAFKQDPEFYAFFRTLESYGRTLGSQTDLFISSNSEYFRFLKESGGK